MAMLLVKKSAAVPAFPLRSLTPLPLTPMRESVAPAPSSVMFPLPMLLWLPMLSSPAEMVVVQLCPWLFPDRVSFAAPLLVSAKEPEMSPDSVASASTLTVAAAPRVMLLSMVVAPVMFSAPPLSVRAAAPRLASAAMPSVPADTVVVPA